MYDARNSYIDIVTKRRAHAVYVLVVGAGVYPFLGHPAPCSVRHHEYLTLVLLQGAQLIEKLANARCFPHSKFECRRAHWGFVYSFHSASQ